VISLVDAETNLEPDKYGNEWKGWSGQDKCKDMESGTYCTCDVNMAPAKTATDVSSKCWSFNGDIKHDVSCKDGQAPSTWRGARNGGQVAGWVCDVQPKIEWHTSFEPIKEPEQPANKWVGWKAQCLEMDKNMFCTCDANFVPGTNESGKFGCIKFDGEHTSASCKDGSAPVVWKEGIAQGFACSPTTVTIKTKEVKQFRNEPKPEQKWIGFSGQNACEKIGKDDSEELAKYCTCDAASVPTTSEDGEKFYCATGGILGGNFKEVKCPPGQKPVAWQGGLFNINKGWACEGDAVDAAVAQANSEAPKGDSLEW
jgi:hypothetical protein